MSSDLPFQLRASDWCITTLGEVCRAGRGDIQTGPFGSQLHASDYVEEGIPSIMPQDIVDGRIDPVGIARITEEDADRLDRYRVKAGDIVYSRRGDIRRRALIREAESGWLCGTGCLRVRVGDRSNPSYIAAYLGHPAVQEWIERHAVGATMLNLNTGILKALPIALPDREEQSRIGGFFDALNDKIESNRRLAGLLEDTAATTFGARFVNFVGAEDLVGSEIGPIPRGWHVGPLTDSMEFLSGGTPRTSNPAYWGGDVPWISVKDTLPGPYVTKTERMVTERALVEARLERYPANTVLITARGTVGNVALMAEPMTLNQSCYAVRGRGGVGQLYVFFLLRQVVGKLRTRAHGSVFSTITRSTFDSISVAYPPLEQIDAFEQDAGPSLSLVRGLARESLALAAMRDALLPQIIAGGIRVPQGSDPEEMIERVNLQGALVP
ncbi:MAG TPA: restriction endonuclease subunit S [Solirubrobacteraceae bacterium]|nr:restriction endonuclease subunit S [Solirubrobacteraceae bacterium]